MKIYTYSHPFLLERVRGGAESDETLFFVFFVVKKKRVRGGAESDENPLDTPADFFLFFFVVARNAWSPSLSVTARRCACFFLFFLGFFGNLIILHLPSVYFTTVFYYCFFITAV